MKLKRFLKMFKFIIFIKLYIYFNFTIFYYFKKIIEFGIGIKPNIIKLSKLNI